MRKKFKVVLLLTLIIGLLAPGSIYAESNYERELNQIYGPENGSVIFLTPEQPVISPLSTFGRTFYTANYEVTTHFQIPYDIKISDSKLNTLRILSKAGINTNSKTTEYNVDLEYFSAWGGGYIGEDSVTIPVDVNRYEYFDGLSTSKTYRLRIVGNVIGTITAYEQTA